MGSRFGSIVHSYIPRFFGIAVSLVAGVAGALPLDVDDTFYYRERNSSNDNGITGGDRLVVGANSVVPNGNAGTTVTGRFGDNTHPLFTVPFNDSFTSPNQFTASRPYDAANALLPMRLQFTNGSDVITRNGANSSGMPSLTPVGTVGSMPFARGVNINGTGTDLTFNWSLPTLSQLTAAGVELERIQISVFDLQSINGVGHARTIFTQNLSASATSFSTSGVSLELGHKYSAAIRLEDLRPGFSPVDGSAPDRLSVSRSFFNFTPTNATLPPNIFQPVHAPGSSFVFDIPVLPGVKFNIDPPVAVGYDYEIGVGNPNFQSVTLPTGIGDNMFDLWLWNGTDWVDTGIDLLGGQEFLFVADGVDRFRITGIETGAGLDPNNTSAFVTGLTFTKAGDFTGTMTPITVDVDVVPVPATLTLLGLGLVGLGFSRRKRAS